MTGKPKILFYCPYLGRGGAEKHFARLAAAFNSDAYEKIVVVSRRGGEYEEILKGSGVVFISLDVNRTSSLLTLVFSIFPLVRLINKARPDIVVSVMDMVNFIVSIVRRLASHQFKVVYLVQASLKSAIAFQKSRLKSFLYKIAPGLYAKADAVVVLSEGVRQEITTRLTPERSRNIFTIHNIGITRDSIMKHTASSRREFSIVCCGRLVKLKGFDVLIRSLALVKAQFPAVSLSIVGDGPEKENLLALVKQLNLEQNVEFVGFVKQPEMYFQKAQIFALTSFLEGFGNVIVEAMVSGAAVVATDCPHGPREIIQHGKNGLLVPVNNVEKLADAIINLLKNRVLMEQVAAEGVVRSRDFLPEVIAKQFEEKIERVLIDQRRSVTGD